MDFAAEIGDDVTGENGIGREVVQPGWVSARHLPSICASIDATKTKTKVHCIYRLACLCKDFKKILYEDTSLHEVLQILGASKFSQMKWFEKRTHTLHLLRYVLGPRIVERISLSPEQGWQHDMRGFLALEGDNKHCASVAYALFNHLSATPFEKFVQRAGRDVSVILTVRLTTSSCTVMGRKFGACRFFGEDPRGIPEIAGHCYAISTQSL